jgi:purine-binding chemotaxis protein CheW
MSAQTRGPSASDRPAANDTGGPAALQVLTFDLGHETFALEAILVREVLDRSPETQVPGAAAFVDAVINFRGRIIPLADLRVAFGLPTAGSSPDSRIIVIEFALASEATLIGLRADKVFEVTTIPLTATETAPRLGTRWRPDFIRCLAKREDEIIVLPDLHKIFATCAQAGASALPAPEPSFQPHGERKT